METFLNAGGRPGLMAAAVTIDLVAGLPALGWFVLVRPRRASPLILIPLALIGIVLANLLLPEPHRRALEFVELAVPILEGLLVIGLILSVRRIVRAYRTCRARTLFAFEAFEQALGTAAPAPALAWFLATELAVVWYALTGWFKRFRPGPGQLAFATHAGGSYGAVLLVMMMILPVELLAVHVLLAKWSHVAAWIASILSAYGVLWLLGDYQAMKLMPIVLDGERLHLRLGMRWSVTVRRADVERVSPIRPTPEPGEEGLFRNLAPMGEAELWITLREPVEVRGLFGLAREARHIGVSIEAADVLRHELSPRTDSH